MEKQYDIPECVLIGLEEVRQGGKYNMFSTNEVFKELFYLEHYDAVVWLTKEDKRNYCEGCEDDSNCGKCRHDQVMVDIKKYAAAINELGQIISLAHMLSRN